MAGACSVYNDQLLNTCTPVHQRYTLGAKCLAEHVSRRNNRHATKACASSTRQAAGARGPEEKLPRNMHWLNRTSHASTPYRSAKPPLFMIPSQCYECFGELRTVDPVLKIVNPERSKWKTKREQSKVSPVNMIVRACIHSQSPTSPMTIASHMMLLILPHHKSALVKASCSTQYLYFGIRDCYSAHSAC